MNHLKWMGHKSTILEITKSLHSDLQSCEVILVGKGHIVKAHRFVLSLCSNLLKRLMADVPIGNECTIILPDINGELLENILSFIYLGETCLNSKNLPEFLDNLITLGITTCVNFQCGPSSFSQTLNLNDGIHSASNLLMQKMVDSNSVITISAADIIANNGIVNGKLTAANMIVNDAETNNANTSNTADNANNAVNASGPPELDFLDVYPEQHQKITYAIETVPDANNGNEYILPETADGYTLEHITKIETNSSIAEADRDGNVNEEDGIEADILADYTTEEDPLLHMNSNVSEIRVSTPEYINNIVIKQMHSTTSSIIHNGVHMKSNKLKNNGAITRIIKKNQKTACDDPLSILDGSDNTSAAAVSAVHHRHQSFDVLKVNGANEVMMELDEAVEQIEINSNVTSNVTPADSTYHIHECISLPTETKRFNISKAEVWQSIRNTDDQKYSKTSKGAHHRVDHDNAIELACKAVIDEGFSLQKAAIKYEISKTVLWRRVRNHPHYMKTTRHNPVVLRAYERLKTGESLKSISQDLDIPMSTLHRHKVRLSQKGELPDFVKCRQRSKGNLKLKLAKAVNACIHDGMSQNHAARLFGISKSTLWRHLQKRVAETELIDINEQSLDTIEENDIKEEVILS